MVSPATAHSGAQDSITVQKRGFEFGKIQRAGMGGVCGGGRKAGSGSIWEGGQKGREKARDS